MKSVTFKGWVARDKIDDEYYPRTFLYANKPRKKEVYELTDDLVWQYEDEDGKLGS